VVDTPIHVNIWFIIKFSIIQVLPINCGGAFQLSIKSCKLSTRPSALR